MKNIYHIRKNDKKYNLLYKDTLLEVFDNKDELLNYLYELVKNKHMYDTYFLEEDGRLDIISKGLFKNKVGAI